MDTVGKNKKAIEEYIKNQQNEEITFMRNIIVTHKDRFIRFGFEWFERFLAVEFMV